MARSYNSKRRPWEGKPVDYNAMPGQGRKSNNQWFYKSKPWRRTRQIKLALQPFCECDECKNLNRTLPATVVDHYKPINPNDPYDLQDGNYPHPLAMDNLRSNNKSCHDKKSAKERHKKQNYE